VIARHRVHDQTASVIRELMPTGCPSWTKGMVPAQPRAMSPPSSTVSSKPR